MKIEDEKAAVVEAHLAQLMEHFDTVQIVTTRYDGDATDCVSRGAGNWYARMASIDEVLRRMRAQEDEPE